MMALAYKTDNILSLIDGKPGDNVALVDCEGKWTYSELMRVSRKIAGYTIKRIGSGHNVIIKMDNSRGFVSALFGCIYSGNSPVPVSNGLTGTELEYIYNKTKCRLILECIAYDEIDSYAETEACDESLPAIIMFTSGTTGVPKGAVISHKNICHTTRVIGEYLDYEKHNSTIIALPMQYSYALVNQVFSQLAVGGTVYILKNLRNPIELFDWINRYSISTFSGVASVFHLLAVFQKLQKLEARSIRVVCSAGAPFAYELFPLIKEIFPKGLVFNNYGLTEAIPRVSYIKETAPNFFKGSCGKPINEMEVRIWNRRKNVFLQENEVGVLVIKGPNVIEEYLDDADETEKSFMADGFFVTGDLAFIKDGEIYIVGREDDIFNSGEEKISPYEIEAQIKKYHAVKDALVVGLPDPQKGRKIAAFLVLKEKVTKKALIEYCGSILSRHKIPTVFLEINKLPTNSNGKVSRKALTDEKYLTNEIR